MHANTYMPPRAHKARWVPGALGQCGAVIDVADVAAVAVAAAMQSADGAGTGSEVSA